MARTKISEFSSTPGSNTDIDGINIAEGCAPSGINDAIRELMAQLKDFQAGTAGDSFNGPVGTSTAAAGAFTTLSASGAVTLSGGTANTVPYLNASKVLTSGSALTFDGTNFGLNNTTGLADNYDSLAFTSTYVPSGTIDTNESGRVQFYNKSQDGTQQLGTSVQASATALSASPTAILGKLKLHAYFSAANVIQDTSYLELVANSTTTLRGNGGLGFRAGSSSQAGKSLYFYTDDGETEQYRITSTGVNIWSPGGTEAMRLNSTGLGIGTSSPGVKLDVAGIARSNTSFDLNNGTVTGTYGAGAFTSGVIGIGSTSNHPLVFGTNSGERMRLDSSGNLGLGVTPSAWGSGRKSLDVNNASFYSQTGNYNGVASNAFNNGSNWIYKTTAAAQLYEQGGGTHAWFTAPSGTAGNAISFTQAMTLDASGSLNVGQTSTVAGERLGVTGGDILITRASGNAAIGLNSTGGSGRRYYLISENVSGNFLLYDNNAGATRLTLDSSGNLGLGVTPSAWSSDYKALQLNGGYGSLASDATNGYVELVSNAYAYGNNTWKFISGGTYYATRYRAGVNGSHAWYTSSGTGTAGNAISFTQAMTLDASGNLLVGTTSTYGGPGRINVGFNQSTNFGLTFRNTSATATGVFVSFENSGGSGNGSISQTNSTTVAYNTSSDRRLKKDIVPAPEAGSDIDAIEVVSHGWVSNNDVVKYGVIAQDLNSIVPQAVCAGDDGEEVKRTWGVDYSKLVPMLVKEIQSLRARVAQLESN